MKTKTILMVAGSVGALLLARSAGLFQKAIPSDEEDSINAVLSSSFFGPTIAPYLINPSSDYQGRHGRNARNISTGYY